MGRVTSATSDREPTAGRTRVRAADVASAAGVSISTVSLVVNDKWEGRVAVDTVARVRAEVDRLGYVVDESARRLATGGAAAVAVVTPAFTNPFYARVSIGAAAALGEAFQVVFSVPEVGDDPVATRRTPPRPAPRRQALVAAPSPELLQVLARDLPTVVLDAPGSAAGPPRVDLDVADGAAQLARHLVDLGHRRVAFFRATPETETFRVRARVARRAPGRRWCRPRVHRPTGERRRSRRGPRRRARLDAGRDRRRRDGRGVRHRSPRLRVAAGVRRARRRRAVDDVGRGLRRPAPVGIRLAAAHHRGVPRRRARVARPDGCSPTSSLAARGDPAAARPMDRRRHGGRSSAPAVRVLPVSLVVRGSTGPASR